MMEGRRWTLLSLARAVRWRSFRSAGQTIPSDIRMLETIRSPVTITLPIKILMFVLVDGWGLIVKALVGSFH